MAVPDVMHDILEGTAQLVLRCLIHYLVLERKLFSFTTLNVRIATFKYGGADVKNKPSEITRSTFISWDSLRHSGKRQKNVLSVDFTRLYPERCLVPKMHYLVLWMRRYVMFEHCDHLGSDVCMSV